MGEITACLYDEIVAENRRKLWMKMVEHCGRDIREENGVNGIEYTRGRTLSERSRWVAHGSKLEGGFSGPEANHKVQVLTEHPHSNVESHISTEHQKSNWSSSPLQGICHFLSFTEVPCYIYTRAVIGKQSSNWRARTPGCRRLVGGVWGATIIMGSLLGSLLCIDSLSFSLKWHPVPPHNPPHICLSRLPLYQSHTHLSWLDWHGGGRESPLAPSKGMTWQSDSLSRSKESLGKIDWGAAPYITGWQTHGSSTADVCPTNPPSEGTRSNMVVTGTHLVEVKKQVRLFQTESKSALANQPDLEDWLVLLDYLIIILHECDRKNLQL